jgi:hypothetical protein
MKKRDQNIQFLKEQYQWSHPRVSSMFEKPQTTRCAKILVHTVDGGKRVHFVEVPKSSCSDQWLTNARRKGWLEEALQISTKGTIDVEEAAVCAIVASITIETPKEIAVVVIADAGFPVYIR